MARKNKRRPKRVVENMEHLPGDRIIGIETEFGCLVEDENIRPEDVVEEIKDHVFRKLKLGMIDLQARDEVFEPAESGGFMINGSRLYIDAVGSHLEYATAETRTIKDLLANERAGQKIILQAIKDLDLQDTVKIYNNSIDHFRGHTFGCHENYFVRMEDDFFSHRINHMFGFLVTRQIFAGVGRVGGHILVPNDRGPSYEEVMANPVDFVWVSQTYDAVPDISVDFQLSQRADHILRTVASRVRFNRALINPKWEHFYSLNQMQRLHVLFGEANQSEYAAALKIGTTNLVLRLIEDELMPEEVLIASPLIALRTVSRDPNYQWLVTTAHDGEQITAIELQRRYWRACEAAYSGKSPDADWILNEWQDVLNRLESDPLALSDRLDWVAKRQIVNEYRDDEGLSWQDDALHSVDLEYHNIDPDQSLYHAYRDHIPMRRVIDDLDILDATTDAPKNTRAFGRSKLVKELLAQSPRPRRYAIDWNGVQMGHVDYRDLEDPFQSYA